MRHVAIAAPARSGKSTVVEMVRQILSPHPCVEIALADPMKRFVRDTFDVDPNPLWGASEGRDFLPPGSKSTVRVLLQTLGTEWGRAHNEDVWVKVLLRNVRTLTEGPLAEMGLVGYTPERGVFLRPERGVFLRKIGIDRAPICLVPDLRFENEAVALRQNGFAIWHLRRDLPNAQSEGWRNHASETGITFQIGDVAIENNGTLAHLREKVQYLAQSLLEGK